MTGKLDRRPWTRATVAEAEEGFDIRFGEKAINTPARAPLRLPSLALAQAIAEEWQSQGDKIAPDTMPLTRMSNSVIDKVTPQRPGVVRMIADYGDTDLLCYRADGPEGLVAHQTEAWDPWITWADTTLNAPLSPASGVMYAAQPLSSLANLNSAVEAHSDFEIAALHDLVTLSGSLVLGLAVSHRALAAADAWQLSRVDEAWQIKQWGADAEAEAAAAIKAAAYLDAERYLQLLREDG